MLSNIEHSITEDMHKALNKAQEEFVTRYYNEKYCDKIYEVLDDEITKTESEIQQERDNK